VVDLGALANNLRVAAKLAGEGVGIMGMVKADAYGHGAVPVSKRLVECGACALGVATVEEGLELREAGIGVPVLVLGGLMGMGATASGVMVSADLTPVIHSTGVLDSLEMVASSMRRTVGVHLQVDTGMTRLGFRIEALPAVLEKLKSCPSLKLDGVMTHLAKASDPEYASYQMEQFSRAKGTIENALGEVPLWHAANSLGLVEGVGIRMDGAQNCWVRPGIMLYGGLDADGIEPVMGLESRLVLVKTVPAGTKISYDCTFTTARRSRIAVIPVGYADGYPRSLSGKSHVLVRGKRAPVVGRVTMDMIMADITDVPEAAVGDIVTLMGRQGDEFITAIDIADWAGTISYEIMTGISARMPRVYRDN
jgi:alanine racemase